MSRSSLKKYKLSSLDRRILNRLQEDIPFEERPWRTMAKELGIGEDRLLKRIAFFKKEGVIRRISGTFCPSRINHVSTLVGVKASSKVARKVAQTISSYPEVTHNYRRAGVYNIWFTLVAKNAVRITQIIRRLKKSKDIKKISEFPVVRLFKINVKFPV